MAVLHHCFQTSRHLHFKLQHLFAASFGFVQPQVRKGVPERYVSKRIFDMLQFEARCTRGHKGAPCQLLAIPLSVSQLPKARSKAARSPSPVPDARKAGA